MMTRNRRDWYILAGLMCAYAALFAVFFPPIAAIEDEVGFINQTFVWSKGVVSSEAAGYENPPLGDFQKWNGRYLATRHPGRSLVALPFFMVLGLPGIFVSGLFLHLAMTWIGGQLLVKLGRSPLWATLLLFHPTLAIYSRTALADSSSGACLLLAALATFSSQGRGVLTGMAVGLSALMRAHAGLTLPFVALSLRFPPRVARPWRDVLGCVLGGAAVGGLNMVYNVALYGSPIDPFSGKRGFFSSEFLIPHALFYGACLMILWPGMLIAPVVDKSPIRWLVRSASGLNLVLFCFYYFHDRSERPLETLVIGQRLIQVAIPIWVVSYAGMIDDHIWSRLRRSLSVRSCRVILATTFIAFFAGNAAMFATHQKHLLRLKTDRDAIAEIVPENSLIICYGPAPKLFGIPVAAKTYRYDLVEFNGFPSDPTATIQAEQGPWYFVILDRFVGAPRAELAEQFLEKYEFEQIPAASPRVHIYRTRGTLRGER